MFYFIVVEVMDSYDRRTKVCSGSQSYVYNLAVRYAPAPFRLKCMFFICILLELRLLFSRKWWECWGLAGSQSTIAIGTDLYVVREQGGKGGKKKKKGGKTKGKAGGSKKKGAKKKKEGGAKKK